jgi:signal peptidase I
MRREAVRQEGDVLRARTRRAKRAGGAGGTVFLGVLVGVLALCVSGLLFLLVSPSYHAFVITGESMQPKIDLGDVVIVGPPGGLFGHSLATGEIVTYRLGGQLVTHRIVSVDAEGLTTRGDAVGVNDARPVKVSQVEGVVLARLPKLGLIPRFLTSRHSLPLLALIPACVCLFVVLCALAQNVRRRILSRRRTERGQDMGFEPGAR